jgi:type VI secretion system secreted protein VgrG
VTTIHLSSDALPSEVEVRRFEAKEVLSAPYEVEVEFALADGDWSVREALRQRAVVSLVDPQGRMRLFDGIIEEAAFVAHTGTDFHFRLKIVPLIANLRHRQDCRLFQEKSAVDVVKEVLAEAGVDEAVDWRLTGSYAPRDIVVQYRETDLSFVQRLLEDEGIAFFFEHVSDGHRCVFADNPDAFVTADDMTKVVFGMDVGVDGMTDPLDVFEREHRLRPNEVALRDFDLRTPAVKPESAAGVDGAWPLKRYEYPAGLKTGQDDDGARRATVRLAALRRDSDLAKGKSAAVGLCPGMPFSVAGASEQACNGEFVVASLRTKGEQGAGDGEGDAGAAGNFLCDNRFAAIPAGKAFSPPRRAKRPRIRGLQTATVTGPSDEVQAIHTDELGRVKVRFHWDRSGIGNDKSSCWLRVAQVGIGGSMIIPRVGWEVSVAFEGGDPDRPFVVGRLYNGKTKPLEDLPGAATVGAFKSMSTPGAAKANEFGAKDEGGGQGFGVGGGKDVNGFVGADKTETVAVDEKQKVAGSLGSTVGATETWNIGGNQSLNSGDAFQVKTGAAQSISVGGNDTVGAEANYIEAIGGARACSIGGSRITISNGVRTLVNGAMTRNVGAIQAFISPSTISDGLGSTYNETVGAVKAEIIAGDSAEEVAGDKILTSSAAELHLVANYATNAATVNRNIGAVHLTSCAGDYEVSAAEIAIVGAVGHFKGGGSSLKLNGGPIVAKGPTITIKSAMIRKTSGVLKLGSS